MRPPGCCAALALMFSVACGRFGFDGSSPAAVDASFELAGNDCDAPVDPGTLALYFFDSSQDSLQDETGMFPATLRGTLQTTPSRRPGCGNALLFDGDEANYALIPNDAAWELDSGSVDLWFRVDNNNAPGGLLSRDADDTQNPGHFTLSVENSGGVRARTQRASSENSDGTVCTTNDVIQIGEWYHIGVNFGPPGLELWFNGQQVDETLPGRACRSGHDGGISGNSNPWVLGVQATSSTEGEELPVVTPFIGAMDHVRISNVRRDFSSI